MKAWALAALFWLVAAPVGCYFYFNKPWYDGEIARRLKQRPGPYAGPVDVTGLIADLFPDEMTKSAAFQLLRSNGFDCSNGSAGKVDLVCERTHSTVACGDQWTIKLSVDKDALIRAREARAWLNCL